MRAVLPSGEGGFLVERPKSATCGHNQKRPMTPETTESELTPTTPSGEQVGSTALFCWVWECVLTDYTDGMAFAFAADEAGAWDALKEADHTAWWNIRGHSEDRDDPRQPYELPKDVPRPRKVTTPEGFACWGGG